MSTGSMSNTQFTKLFSLMIGAFFVLTLVLIVLGNIMASDVAGRIAEEKVGEHAKFVQQRVSPVEQAVIGAPPAETTTVAAVAKSGEEVYNTACVACHLAGVANAPKFGDKAAWDERLAQGVDTLYQNAVAGIRGMPAKGGNAALADDEVRGAVDYILENAK